LKNLPQELQVVSVFHGFLVSFDVFCAIFARLGVNTFHTAHADFDTKLHTSFHKPQMRPLFESLTSPIFKSRLTIDKYLKNNLYNIILH
jgi:hypothetical protein